MLCAGGDGSGTNEVNLSRGRISETRNVQLIPIFRQGDSGGPLTVDEDGVHTLAGVTSHGLSETPQIKVRNNQQRFSFKYSFKGRS